MAAKFKALVKAVKKNSLTSVEQVLSDRSVEFDINKLVDRDNRRTVLHLAVEIKTVKIEIVKLLLHNNAKVNIQDGMQISPLHTAVQKNRIEVVELLLKRGADPNCRNFIGETPFHDCFKRRNILIMNLMLKYRGDINVKDRHGRNALHHAAEYGTCEMVKRLVQMGMNVNEKKTDGWTPLHLAADESNRNTEGSLSKIRILIQHGADINARDVQGFTSLCWAVETYMIDCEESGVFETINRLLELGADPNVHGNESLLYRATSSRNMKLVELLTEYGANVHFKDVDGCSLLNTVLFSAWHDGEEGNVVKPALNIVKLLLIRGVQLTQNDHLNIKPSRFQKLKECVSEYNNLKVTRICESRRLTYGDLLIISNVVLARHLRRKDVCTGIESDQKKDFINYFSENIEKKYLRGLELRKLSNDFIDLLDEVFETVLDHDVVVLISEYINEDDLNKCFSKIVEDR